MGNPRGGRQEPRAYRVPRRGPSSYVLCSKLHSMRMMEFVGVFTICAIERLHTTRELARLRYLFRIGTEGGDDAYFLNKSSKACRASLWRGAGTGVVAWDCWA